MSESAVRGTHIVAAWAVLACGVACAPQLPEAPIERALVRDLARVVEVKAGTGWLIDEMEIEATLPDAMKSVCQVDDAIRTQSLAWLQGRIAQLGGDVASVYRARNRDLDAVTDLLFVTRMHLLLMRADDWADDGKCPFWLSPSPRFSGVHVIAHRFVASVDAGGRATMERALGQWRFGGGGSGRLLGGYAFNEKWSLLAGMELGGSARFTNLALGRVEDLPELVAFGALPVVGHYNFGLSTYAEVEVGPMAFVDSATADQTSGKISADSAVGIRLGGTVGAYYLRLKQGVIPKVAFSITADYLPAVRGQPALLQLGFGLRTGLDFSFWRRF